MSDHGQNFLAAPSQPFFSSVSVGITNAAPVGWGRLDPSWEKMLTAGEHCHFSRKTYFQVIYMVNQCSWTTPKPKGKLKVWPCVTVWGMWGHDPPKIKTLGFFSKCHRFGCYLKQELSEEALNWWCLCKWPAWCHGHHLIGQESLQEQVEVLFRSVAFFTTNPSKY